MDEFVISPAEALLIGVCMGEYRVLKSEKAGLPFFQVLHSRLEPFVPSFDLYRLTPIPKAAIPRDVGWLPIEDMKVGSSPTHPRTIYGINEKGAFKKLVDHSRKDLLTLVELYTAEVVGMSEQMRRLSKSYARATNPDIASMGRDLCRALLESDDFGTEAFDAKTWGLDGRADDREGITSRIETLIRSNASDATYQLGKYFGGVIASLTLYEDGWSPYFFISVFGTSIVGLSKAREIQDSTVARSALEYMASRFIQEREATIPGLRRLQEWYEKGLSVDELVAAADRLRNEPGQSEAVRDLLKQQETEAEELRRSAATRIREAAMALWVTLGETLGALRARDEDVKKADAELFAPRSIKIMGTDSLDKIRNAIRQAEQDLNKPGTEPTLAERGGAPCNGPSD
jgi:hypothetical protein